MNPFELLADTDTLCNALRSRTEPDAPTRPWTDEILARYDEVDARLVAAGFPPTSAWWRQTIERWVRSGRRQLVGRIGRRGGKSSTLSRLAVVVALYGRHVIPPGDLGVGAVISTDKSEALGRLRTIEAVLDALGIAHKPSQAPKLGLELVGRPIEFRVFAATIKGVSGFTAVFVLCDEVAKWRDADTGVNPATTVLASVRPTMTTQPNALMVMSSSPMGRFDAHFDAFEEGDTPLQVTAHAPTWVANPTVSEADTHTLEPDEATWSREYAAVPQAEAETSLLTEVLIDRCIRRGSEPLERRAGYHYFAAIDPATRGNAWTLAVATRDSKGTRIVVCVREWRGTPSAPLSPRAVFQDIAGEVGRYGIRWLDTDQWAIDALRDSARDAGLSLREQAWTTSTKAEAYEALLNHARSSELELPDVPEVKTDLLGIRKKLTRNGVTYELATVNGRHSDFAPCIALVVQAAHFKAEGDAPPPPTAEQRQARGKVEFLESLTRERKRQERFGTLPATHRRFR